MLRAARLIGTAATLSLALPAATASALDGELDPSFDGDGRLTNSVDPSTGDATFHDVALQPDGKIVAAGFDEVGGPGEEHDFVVARFNPDGSVDDGFENFSSGRAGVFELDLAAGVDAEAHAIAIQPDGKIVIAGFVRGAGADVDLALVRLTPDGEFDEDFDGAGPGDGIVVTDLNPTGDDRANDVAIDSQGRIVVVGQADTLAGTPVNLDFAFLRYLPTGAVDPSFSENGQATVETSVNAGDPDVAETVALDSEDRIVAAGNAAGFQGDASFAAVRYLEDGTPDSTFSNDGEQLIGVAPPLGLGNDFAHGLAIQPDGRIVLAGHGDADTGTGTENDMAFARLLPDGTLDPGFDGPGPVIGDGKFMLETGQGSDTALATTLQPDGKIVAAGGITSGATSADFALVRLLPETGALEPEFGGDGILTTDFEGGSDAAFSVALQPDGRILTAGRATTVAGGGFDLALARYLNESIAPPPLPETPSPVPTPPSPTEAQAPRDPSCAALRAQLKRAKSKKAKRALRRKLRNRRC